LLAVTQDVRVLLVKLADRLHNMRTLDYMRDDKRQRIAEETIEIYAPLAGRMGMQEIREELEELAFRHIKPEAHQLISAKVAGILAVSDKVISEIKEQLKTRLDMRGIEAEVSGRAKRPYSVWRKMERKSISFEQLSDIFGFRVLVPEVEDCYRVLGVIHTTWPMVPGRYKDYISTPKQNDYRSLHTTVVGPGHQRVELQIRTEAMDRWPNMASPPMRSTRTAAPAPRMI
jgi:GTP diphosphokinase / guanosine-3',5'-bis(diphosphate) 3'-diphosphatase